MESDFVGIIAFGIFVADSNNIRERGGYIKTNNFIFIFFSSLLLSSVIDSFYWSIVFYRGNLLAGYLLPSTLILTIGI